MDSFQTPKSIRRAVIKCPENLCIYGENYQESLDFFDKISTAVFVDCKYIKLDFSELEKITAAAAVILFAHVTRCQNCAPLEIFKYRDQVVDSDFRHNKKGYEFAREIFLIDAIRQGGKGKLDKLWDSRVCPFKTSNEPSIAAAEIVLWLKSFNPNMPRKMIRAIGEALLNINHHSYGPYMNKKTPLNEFMISRWWQLGAVTEDAFRFIIYDMGAGIPTVAGRKIFLENDSNVIERAMERGFSSTGIAGRGNGSADLLSPISQENEEDYLHVYSNKGFVGYRNGKMYLKEDNKYSIGGTLLEWVFYN